MEKLYAVLLFTFTFSLSTFLCKAQFNVYHPFPDSNAGWRETIFYTPSTVEYVEFDYYVNGDTIVNGKKYKKLNTSGGYSFIPNGPPDSTWYCYDSLYCLLREDTSTRKVYVCFPNYTKDTLLYNFNLHVGDTLRQTYIKRWGDTETVKAIDSVLVGSTYRKQFLIALNNYSNNVVFDSLIEGIGSSEGLLELMVPPFESGSWMDCFTDSTVQFSYGATYPCNIFHKCHDAGIAAVGKPETSVSVYPNPSSGNYKFQITNYAMQKVNIEVFNVLGEKVYSKFTVHNSPFTIDLSSNPNGIYLYRITSENGALIGAGKLMIRK